MARGIPPSLDRMALSRNLLLMGAVCLVVIVVGVVVITRSRAGLDSLGSEELGQGLGRSGHFKSEQEELGSALAMAQRYVLRQLNPSRVRNVAWIETHHEGHRGWYKFDGYLQVEDTDGKAHRLSYTVVLHLDVGGQWVLEDVEVRR